METYLIWSGLAGLVWSDRIFFGDEKLKDLEILYGICGTYWRMKHARGGSSLIGEPLRLSSYRRAKSWETLKFDRHQGFIWNQDGSTWTHGHMESFMIDHFEWMKTELY